MDLGALNRQLRDLNALIPQVAGVVVALIALVGTILGAVQGGSSERATGSNVGSVATATVAPSAPQPGAKSNIVDVATVYWLTYADEITVGDKVYPNSFRGNSGGKVVIDNWENYRLVDFYVAFDPEVSDGPDLKHFWYNGISHEIRRGEVIHIRKPLKAREIHIDKGMLLLSPAVYK